MLKKIFYDKISKKEFDDFNDLEEAEDDLIEEYDEPVGKVEIKGCCPNCNFKDNISVFKYIEVE